MIVFPTKAESLMPNDLAFFQKAGTHYDVQIAENLLGAGVSFKFEFFNVRSYSDGVCLAVADLPVTMIKIMNGQITAEQKLALAKVTAAFLKDTGITMGKLSPVALPPSKKSNVKDTAGTKFVFTAGEPETTTEKKTEVFIKDVNIAFGKMDKAFHEAHESAKSAANATKEAAEAAYGLNLDAPVDLSKAEYLGQAVKGTGTGSIYRLAGLRGTASTSPRLAARFDSGNASFRVAGSLTIGDKKNLTNVGFKIKDGYWSLHMSIGAIPRMRVLGAILFDLADSFPVHVNSFEELGCD